VAGKYTWGGGGGGGRAVIRNVEHANIIVVVSRLWRTWLLRVRIHHQGWWWAPTTSNYWHLKEWIKKFKKTIRPIWVKTHIYIWNYVSSSFVCAHVPWRRPLTAVVRCCSLRNYYYPHWSIVFGTIKMSPEDVVNTRRFDLTGFRPFAFLLEIDHSVFAVLHCNRVIYRRRVVTT